jgi:hypothetical protein
MTHVDDYTKQVGQAQTYPDVTKMYEAQHGSYKDPVAPSRITSDPKSPPMAAPFTLK